MKFIAAILALYIFALNLAPCEDYVTVDKELKTEISQAAGNDHQHPNSDLCSPFCKCNCCHVNVLQFHPTEISIVVNGISTEFFLYFDSWGKDTLNTLLQPPRV